MHDVLPLSEQRLSMNGSRPVYTGAARRQKRHRYAQNSRAGLDGQCSWGAVDIIGLTDD